jgi:hypothetical protein
LISRARFRSFGRLLALTATAIVLGATSVPPCVPADRGTFDVATTCGPPGVVTLSYEGARWTSCTGGCWAFLDASGAGAVGLPEQGEIHPQWSPPNGQGQDGSPLPPGTVFAAVAFALVGDAPVEGTTPTVTVRRTCRATPSSAAGVVDIACRGEDPVAACAGTLTLRPRVP